MDGHDRAGWITVFAADADLDWMLIVFYALVHEASMRDADDRSVDDFANQVVDTLLHGFGPRPGDQQP